jgi:hypothetical protein
VDFALMHDDLKEDFKSHLRSIIDWMYTAVYE